MKRSTPLRRSSSLRTTSPMRRRTQLRARSKTNSHARRDRGRAYMGWISRQPCIVREFFALLLYAAVGSLTTPAHPVDLACAGRVEVDHAGDRFKQGNGKRAHDRTCIPICTKHHRMRTSWAGTLGQAGIFFGFSREALRRWCDEAIRIQHALAASAHIEVPAC